MFLTCIRIIALLEFSLVIENAPADECSEMRVIAATEAVRIRRSQRAVQLSWSMGAIRGSMGLIRTVTMQVRLIPIWPLETYYV